MFIFWKMSSGHTTQENDTPSPTFNWIDPQRGIGPQGPHPMPDEMLLGPCTYLRYLTNKDEVHVVLWKTWTALTWVPPVHSLHRKQLWAKAARSTTFLACHLVNGYSRGIMASDPYHRPGLKLPRLALNFWQSSSAEIFNTASLVMYL